MKKKWKVLFAMFLMVLVTLSCSSCLAAGVAAFVLVEEERRENHKMDCELVGEPIMTFLQNKQGMYEVTVDFVLKNMGDEDCYDWKCVVSIYDENDCMLDSYAYYETTGDVVLKMGEETHLQVDDLKTYYQPVSVRVWDICIYEDYNGIIKN